MIEDYIELVKQLTNYYLEQFSHATCPTLAVKQEEVEIIKGLLTLVGGKETQEIQVICWNAARKYYACKFFGNLSIARLIEFLRTVLVVFVNRP